DESATKGTGGDERKPSLTARATKVAAQIPPTPHQLVGGRSDEHRGGYAMDHEQGARHALQNQHGRSIVQPRPNGRARSANLPLWRCDVPSRATVDLAATTNPNGSYSIRRCAAGGARTREYRARSLRFQPTIRPVAALPAMPPRSSRCVAAASSAWDPGEP